MKFDSSAQLSRGGAPVGVLSELPPVELAAIIYLRLWFSGKQQQVWSDFASTLGKSDAKAAMACFEGLMHSVQHHTKRPLMRHDATCQCFGGDECAFAQVVAAATSGDEHEAMTFALHLFDGVQARCVLGAAAICGHAFADMASRPEPVHSPTHPSPRLTQ